MTERAKSKRCHRMLVDNIEAELAGIGCVVTVARRREMMRWLDGIERLRILGSDIVEIDEPGGGLEEADPDAPWICEPAEWMPAAQCA